MSRSLSSVARDSIVSAFILLMIDGVTSYTTSGFTTLEPEVWTHNLNHVGIPSRLPNASQESLLRYNIVPHYITDIPEFGVEVIFPSGVKAEFGNILSVNHTLKAPKVTWPEAEDEEFYSLFMIDPDVYKEVVPETSYQYILWLVGNIPGGQVSKGEILVHYQLPRLTKEYHRFHRVITIIHYQMEGKKNFSEPLLRKNVTEFRNTLFIQNFTRKYFLHGPVAANFFRLHVPMNDDMS